MSSLRRDCETHDKYHGYDNKNALPHFVSPPINPEWSDSTAEADGGFEQAEAFSLSALEV